MSKDATRIDIEEAGVVIIEYQGEEWEIFVDDRGELAILRPDRFAHSDAFQELLEEDINRLEERRDEFSREST